MKTTLTLSVAFELMTYSDSTVADSTVVVVAEPEAAAVVVAAVAVVVVAVEALEENSI